MLDDAGGLSRRHVQSPLLGISDHFPQQEKTVSLKRAKHTIRKNFQSDVYVCNIRTTDRQTTSKEKPKGLTSTI